MFTFQSMINEKRRSIAASLITLVLLGGSLPAVAAPDELGVQRAVTVRFGDLDLTHEAGAAALYRRLQAAARSVCGSDELRNVQRNFGWRKCYEKAMARAVRKVDRPLLAALYRGVNEESGS